jgi:RNA polymerase sigma-70 factor (ECF subfamily)
VDTSLPGGDVTIGRDGSAAAEIGVTPPARALRSRIDHAREEAALELARNDKCREALQILMTAYGTAIYTFALRSLRDRELAHDVRQQVFLEAFEHLRTFEERSSLWTWLCKITVNRCIDERRRADRRPTDSLDALDVWDKIAGPSELSMDADRVAKQRALEHCLGKLPKPMRIQVLMRYFLGLSHAEISDQVGDSAGTVQVRLTRILPQLRRCLAKKGVRDERG